MPKQVQIDDNDVPALIEFYQTKRAAIKKQLDAIDGVLRQLSNSSVNLFQHTPDGDKGVFYPTAGKWRDKIYFIVEHAGRISTSKVIDEIIKQEPKWQNKRKQLLPTISGLLAENAKEGGKLKRENNGNEYIYSVNN